jgi:hypothetical protein
VVAEEEKAGGVNMSRRYDRILKVVLVLWVWLWAQVTYWEDQVTVLTSTLHACQRELKDGKAFLVRPCISISIPSYRLDLTLLAPLCRSRQGRNTRASCPCACSAR